MSEIQPYSATPAPVPHPAPLAAGHPQWQQPGLVTDQRPVSGAVVVLAWVSAVLTVGYMLPWAIAATRGRSNTAAIGVLNLLLGWSLVGWIVALVMACQAHAVVATGGPVNVVVAQQFPQAHFAGPPPPVQVHPPAGWYPAADGQGRAYWDGQAWTGHRAP